MKLSQYIDALQGLLLEAGDVDVETHSGCGFNRMEARAPAISYRKVLSVRETKPRFWSGSMPEESKGDKVVKV